jgi:hypothetical protein
MALPLEPWRRFGGEVIDPALNFEPSWLGPGRLETVVTVDLSAA